MMWRLGGGTGRRGPGRPPLLRRRQCSWRCYSSCGSATRTIWRLPGGRPRQGTARCVHRSAACSSEEHGRTPSTRPLLRRALERSELPESQLNHLRMALVAEDDGHVEPLYRQILNADPPELTQLAAALRPYKDRLTGPLWEVAGDGNTTPERRFRAPSWRHGGLRPDFSQAGGLQELIARQLLGMNSLYLNHCNTALRPVHEIIREPLVQAFRDSTHTPTRRRQPIFFRNNSTINRDCWRICC